VTPEAGTFLAKARQLLAEAHAVAGIGLAEAAGRAAYLAAFHAAQALIFDRTGKIAKSHGGVRSEFARLVKGNEQVDPAFSAFLAQAYRFKSVADYGVGIEPAISLEEAEQAIETAGHLIECVSVALGG
jgi:uncharacterized protein (UPF0332 family)